MDVTTSSFEDGSKSKIERHYAKDGALISAQVDQVFGSHHVRRLLTFKSHTVSLKVESDKGSRFYTWSLPFEIRHTALFAHGKRNPKVGATVTDFEFGATNDQTRLETISYLGDEFIDYRHTKRLAHKLVSKYGTSWVDDNGLPYKEIRQDGFSYLRD